MPPLLSPHTHEALPLAGAQTGQVCPIANEQDKSAMGRESRGLISMPRLHCMADLRVKATAERLLLCQ